MRSELQRIRLWVVILLCLTFEGVIISKLVYLQVIKGEDFKKKVKKQSSVKLKVNPRRGRIYDRRRRILATTIQGKRVYPLGVLAGQVIGFVGKDGKGLEGVEYLFDSLLAGRGGWRTFGKTPMGKLYPYPGYPQDEILEGYDLILTIDADIQAIVEEELYKRVKELNAKGGMGLVVAPTTGEILAMVNLPPFNPNQWKRYRCWRNRVVQDEFEPGSIFKLVPLSIILKEKICSLKDTVEDGSSRITIRGKVIHDVRKHPPFTFEEALWHSSNVAFVRLGRKIGKKRLYQEALLFGFNNLTGIELPGEVKGKLSSPDSWGVLRFANLMFGQGLTCSFLQLVFAYQAIANQGVLLEPIIIKEIQRKTPTPIVVYKAQPKVVRRVVSVEVATLITKLLVGVIEEGSGILAKHSSISVAGKTGTANKCRGGRYVSSYICSFICFFPTERPMFVVGCMIDEPKGKYLAGEVLGPTIKNIIQKLTTLSPYREKINET